MHLSIGTTLKITLNYSWVIFVVHPGIYCLECLDTQGVTRVQVSSCLLKLDGLQILSTKLK